MVTPRLPAQASANLARSSRSPPASARPLYLGYAQGGQGAGGGSGAINDDPVLELASRGAIAVDLMGTVSLDKVTAAGPVDILGDSVTVSAIQNLGDATGTANGGATTVTARLGDVTSSQGFESDHGPLSVSAPNGDVTLAAALGRWRDHHSRRWLADVGYASTLGSANTSTGQLIYNNAPVKITAAQLVLGAAGSAIAGDSYGGFQLTATNGDATVGNLYFGGGAHLDLSGRWERLRFTARPRSVPARTPRPWAEAIRPRRPVPSRLPPPGRNGDVVVGGGDGQGFIIGTASLTAEATRDISVLVSGPLGLDLAQAGPQRFDHLRRADARGAGCGTGCRAGHAEPGDPPTQRLSHPHRQQHLRRARRRHRDERVGQPDQRPGRPKSFGRRRRHPSGLARFGPGRQPDLVRPNRSGRDRGRGPERGRRRSGHPRRQQCGGGNLALAAASVSLSGPISALTGGVLIDATNGGVTAPGQRPLSPRRGPSPFPRRGAVGRSRPTLERRRSEPDRRVGHDGGRSPPRAPVTATAGSGALTLALPSPQPADTTLSGAGISLGAGQLGGRLDARVRRGRDAWLSSPSEAR